MIAAVSPCSTSTDHTVNTLRYADRVKENPTGKVGGRKNRHAAAPIADYASSTFDHFIYGVFLLVTQ